MRRLSHWNRSPAAIAVLLCCGLVGPRIHLVVAQEPATSEKQLNVIVTQTGIDPAQRSQIEFPDPESVTITTPDGISIAATFYGGVLGKKTPVLILLHDLAGDSTDLNTLARWLQQNYGYASIVPDLRGHGQSVLADKPDLKPDKFTAAQFVSIAADIEGCKRFLRDQKNNEGLLNIDMLTLVAVGKSNILAVEWSLADWSFPTLNGKKQGQDVKQLVMISPETSYKGSRMTALKEPLFSGKNFESPLHVWLNCHGDDPEQERDVDSIESSLMKGRKNTQNAGVYRATYDASGAAIANIDSFRSGLGEFVYFKLYSDAGKFPWVVRGIK